jgi:phage terminase Nu1 subunit (DNA packaging protein)
MARMNVTAIASACGVHKSTVSRQVRAAGLVGADGLVELEDYRALRGGLDPALQTTGKAAPRAAPAAFDPDAPVLAAERARKMAADAQLAELALAKQRGEVLDREDVQRAQEDLARNLRARILMVPDQVAHELALLPDEAAIRGHLVLALERALTEMHNALRGPA